MRIFNYNPDTGELVTEGQARQDPQDAEHYLVPRFATPVEPPDEVLEGKVALFNPETSTWSIADDDRGIWFTADGAAIEVLALGAKIPQAVTRIAPPEPFQKFDGTAWQSDKERKTAAAIADARAACEADLASIRDQYPLSEILSWPKQEAEARALALDQRAPTPLLTAMAAARGIGVQDLAQRVIRKADDYTLIVGQVVGARQKQQDDIERAAAADTSEASTKK